MKIFNYKRLLLPFSVLGGDESKSEILSGLKVSTGKWRRNRNSFDTGTASAYRSILVKKCTIAKAVINFQYLLVFIGLTFGALCPKFKLVLLANISIFNTLTIVAKIRGLFYLKYWKLSAESSLKCSRVEHLMKWTRKKRRKKLAG